VPLASLHRRDIHRVLDRIKERGSLSMAGRTFTDLRAMLSWAVARGYLENNPAAHMDEAPTAKPRERYLSDEEIAALWPALSAFKKPVELALKLALVTGQRIGEVCGISDNELDLAKALWTIPAERSKNGQSHTVPLSEMALELIAETRSGGRSLSCTPDRIAHVLAYHMQSLPVKEWRAHDLRRTVCTHLAKMGFSPIVIGSVVNHRQVTKAGVTLGTYVQYDYAREKRDALDAWADRLSAIVTGTESQIISMRAGASA
jgi:integrase